MGLPGNYDQWKTASPWDEADDLPIDQLEQAIRALNEGRNMKEFYHSLEWSPVACPECGGQWQTLFQRTIWNGRCIDEEGDEKLVHVKCSCGTEFSADSVLTKKQHSRGCWGLCSFGWKDADLDAEGCTGIDKIVSATEDNITVEVGGHKTLCDPTFECEFELSSEDEENYQEWAQSIVIDAPFSGEWTGDDWSLSNRETFQVDWIVSDETGDFDIEATAKAIVEKAHEAIKPFETAMAEASSDLDEVYRHMREKYEQAA
jgi:hypothetical protein